MTVSSVNDVGELDIHMWKNKTGPLSHTLCKNQLKVDERLKHKAWIHETTRKHMEKWLPAVMMLWAMTPKANR
jgi:hypothetical protein